MSLSAPAKEGGYDRKQVEMMGKLQAYRQYILMYTRQNIERIMQRVNSYVSNRGIFEQVAIHNYTLLLSMQTQVGEIVRGHYLWT